MRFKEESGKTSVYCNKCGGQIEFKTWGEAYDYIIEHEWVSFFKDGEWQDFCRECAKREGLR